MFNLETPRVVEEVLRRGSRRVMLQLPDGLRPLAVGLADEIHRATGSQVIISGDSCYGACDVASRQAREAGADLLVHYGHSPVVDLDDMQVIYVQGSVDVDVKRLVEDSLPLLGGYKRIGVAVTVQHVHQVQEVAAELESRGYEVHVGEGDSRAPYRGQVLGCYYGAAVRGAQGVDAFLCIGGGQFHSIGLALATGKPVVAADPYSGSVTNVGPAELMGFAKRRMAAIEIARNAKTVGILVSSKPGQRGFEVAEELERRLEGVGVKAAIIYLDEVRAEHLNNFTEPQAFIVTACPRIALDGVAGVVRPMLTVLEAQVALGDVTWDEAWGRGLMA